MKLIVILLFHSCCIVKTKEIEYCTHRYDHPFCKFNCMTLPELCNCKKDSSGCDRNKDAEHIQVPLTQDNILEMENVINDIRNEAVKGNLNFKLKDNHLFPGKSYPPLSLYKIVSIL